MCCTGRRSWASAGPDAAPPFRIDVVGEAKGAMTLASGLPFEVKRSIDGIAATDIVIVPSVVLGPEGW
ncbi:MAG: hypothetical protein EOO54_08255, partial [Haliea sp.]